MRIGSAFLKARDNKEDRVQKRRSDNMAAFNSYVKTQSELGVEASVQDLEKMKQNLAGGDFFYGKQLPSSNVIEETSSRLGAIKADKEAEEARTVLQNANTKADGMRASMAGFLGANPDNAAWWNANSQSGPLKAVVDMYGDTQAKVYLKNLNDRGVAEYIRDFDLSSYKTIDGIEAAVSAAPAWQQPKIKAYLKSNLQQWTNTERNNGKNAAQTALPGIVKNALTEDAAVTAALAAGKLGMSDDATTNYAWRDAITQQAKAAFALRLKPRFTKAQGIASGQNDKNLFTNKAARDLAVNKILADAEILDDGSKEVDDLKTQLNNTLKTNASVANTAFEDATITALSAKIALLPPSTLDHLTAEDDPQKKVMELITSMGLDLTGTRWVDPNGQPTPFFKIIQNKVLAQITPKIARGLVLANDVDEANIELEIFGGVANGKGQSAAIAEYINMPQDADRMGKLFTEVNRIRVENDKPPFKSIELAQGDEVDDGWTAVWKQLSDRIGLSQTTLYNTRRDAAVKTADAQILEAQETAQGLIGNLINDNDKESPEFKALNYVVGKFFLPQGEQELSAIYQQVMDVIRTEGLTFDDVDEGVEARYRISQVVKSLNVLTKASGQARFRAALLRKAVDGIVKPGSSLTAWATTNIDGLDDKQMRFTLDMEALTLDADPLIIAQKQKLLDKAIKNWDALKIALAASAETPQVGGVLANPEKHAAELTQVYKDIDEKIKTLKNTKPTGTPTFFNRDPASNRFEVREGLGDSAEQIGFKMFTLYKRDLEGGFVIDTAATVAKYPNGAPAAVGPDGGPTTSAQPPIISPEDNADPVRFASPLAAEPLYSNIVDPYRTLDGKSAPRFMNPTGAATLKTVKVNAKFSTGRVRALINTKFETVSDEDKPVVSAILRSEAFARYLTKNDGSKGAMFGVWDGYNGNSLETMFANPRQFLENMANLDLESVAKGDRYEANQLWKPTADEAKKLLAAISAYEEDMFD